MGSEPVSLEPAPLLEGARGDLVGVGAAEGFGGMAGGAMVSCSALRSFESMVAAASRSRAPPQVEQNRPLEETCAPQEEQYMEPRFYHRGRPRCDTPPRKASNYEMRSTWTAVPYARTSVTPCMTSVAS